MNARIRELIALHADLPVEIDAVADEADLYRIGMRSFACVRLMLALEEAFSFEFPEELLTRDTFCSVASIEKTVAALAEGVLAA